MVEKIEDLIQFETLNVDMPNLSFDRIRKWIFQVTDLYQKECGDLCYIFCNDDEILKINIEYLQHDYFTDIITFDYSVDSIVSGDLYISLDTVLSNAEKFQVDSDEELLRVIIHGVLHLCGLKDKTEVEAQKMRLAENSALTIYNAI